MVFLEIAVSNKPKPFVSRMRRAKTNQIIFTLVLKIMLMGIHSFPELEESC